MESTETMLSIREVCEFFGGKKEPLDQSTVYRWVRERKLPKPVRVGLQTVRWCKSDCDRLMAAMVAASQEQPEGGAR